MAGMTPAAHYQVAMGIMRGHDVLAAPDPHRIPPVTMTAEQSTEGASWVIAHALLGLLALELDERNLLPVTE